MPLPCALVLAHEGVPLPMSKRSVVVSAFTPEANLKRKIRTHLQKLGFEKTQGRAFRPPSTSKETVRALHQEQRKAIIKDQRRFLSEALPPLSKHFANGDEIDPGKVVPRLEIVEAHTWQSDLFRLASLTWSVPVSAGFGRRLRYLVWDDNNQKLLGIIALGDPVFNLKVRDELIDWTVKDRANRLVNILDAYVLGAVPPYNMLLGGKLVACLVRSKEVRDDFLKKYGETRGIISKKKKGARLVMVTTSSSLGRSSVYNRLKLNGQRYFDSIGYTQGWGHFHIPDTLFADLRAYLRRKSHMYVDGHTFGKGPNWRLRTIRVALEALGFKGDLLRHGIGREVFACSLAGNAKNILRGKAKRAVYRNLLSVHDVGILARERWLVPRAATRPEFKEWRREQLHDLVSVAVRKVADEAPQLSSRLRQDDARAPS
jgi:hypothetical protein